MTGTSTKGPITAANAWLLPIPKMATATAMASSKLLLAYVSYSSLSICYLKQHIFVKVYISKKFFNSSLFPIRFYI